MQRSTFIKTITASCATLSTLSMDAFAQDLPPLSPTNGGRSALPSLLKVGDIILSTTKEFISAIIRNQTDFPISHTRIVSDIQNTQNPEFVEAVSGGVRPISYSSIMKSDTLLVALRAPNFPPTRVKGLQEWLLTKLGADYDYGGVFEEWLSLKIKWKNTLRTVALGSPKKFYCSELVAEAYRNIGVDLLKYNGDAPNKNSAPGRFVELSWFNELDYVGHLKY